MDAPPQILVIAASGLGIFVQALSALAAIRHHHRDARIVLIAAPEAAAFAAASPYVDEVRSLELPPRWRMRARRDLAAALQRERFARIYDLEGGAYGANLFRLMFARTERAMAPWSGDFPGTALPPADAGEGFHLRDRMAAQLRAAGIASLPPPDLTWVAGRVTTYTLPVRITDPVLLIAADPPGARHGWPLSRFASLAKALAADGVVPVIVGAYPAPDLFEAVREVAPAAQDISGHRRIEDLVFLAWAARGAVGRDGGLMDVFAAAGCRTVVLYDAASDPARSGQRGSDVIILRRPRVADIPAGEVLAALRRKG